MKIKALGASLLIASALSTAAFAENQYVKLELGVVKPTGFIKDINKSVKDMSGKAKSTPMSMGVAYGYQFDKNIRSEVSLSRVRLAKQSYATAKADGDLAANDLKSLDQKFDATSLMFSAFYDFTGVSESVKPYVMGGLGLTHSKAKSSKSYKGATAIIDRENKDTTTGLSYQVGLGVNLAMTEQLSLDMGLKHINYGVKFQDIESGVKKQSKANSVNVGLKFHF